MRIYQVLGTAPLGRDRLAAVQAGQSDYLISFPDSQKFPDKRSPQLTYLAADLILKAAIGISADQSKGAIP